MLLIFSRNTNLYLSAEKKMGTYSAWLPDVNENSIQRLGKYYDIRPEKIPDAIYVEEQYDRFIPLITEKGFRSESLESGAFLLRKWFPLLTWIPRVCFLRRFTRKWRSLALFATRLRVVEEQYIFRSRRAWFYPHRRGVLNITLNGPDDSIDVRLAMVLSQDDN